jgi:HK97 family phage major capsid protein/HK97 family phage prohead protease
MLRYEYNPFRIVSDIPTPVRASLRRETNVRTFFRDGIAADLANSNGRIVSYVFSTQDVARDNHTIDTAGIDHRNFDRNPVFLWAHDATLPPIGRVLDLRVQGSKLVGEVQYAEADENPLADNVFRLVKGGFVSATSIGWIPVEWKYTSDRSRPGGIDFAKVELLEISQVPVPALPSALVTARAQGIDTRPIYEWTERMLDAGNLPATMRRSELEILRREAKMPTPKRDVQQTIVMPTRRAKFRSLAENVLAVARATTCHSIDDRLQRAPSGLNTEDPTAGGWLIEPEFSQQWITSIYGMSPFAGLCDRRQTDNPLGEVKIPGIDETSRADGSRNGGVLAVWPREGTAVNASIPRWKMIEFAGNKVQAYVFGTNELMNDAPMFEAHLNKVVPEELAFQLDLKIISGSGVGVPLGVLNSSALITVPKVGGQTAATIVNNNILDMWRRLPAPSRRNAIWLVNEDADAQLEILATDAAGPPNIYIPAGMCGNEYPLLKGKPTIAIEQCPVLGQLGDIILMDPSNYIIADGGIKTAVSLHAQFINDQAVLRFTWWVDGQPAFASPITPYNGSNTRSPFIALAPR